MSPHVQCPISINGLLISLFGPHFYFIMLCIGIELQASLKLLIRTFQFTCVCLSLSLQLKVYELGLDKDTMLSTVQNHFFFHKGMQFMEASPLSLHYVTMSANYTLWTTHRSYEEEGFWEDNWFGAVPLSMYIFLPHKYPWYTPPQQYIPLIAEKSPR